MEETDHRFQNPEQQAVKGTGLNRLAESMERQETAYGDLAMPQKAQQPVISGAPPEALPSRNPAKRKRKLWLLLLLSCLVLVAGVLAILLLPPIHSARKALAHTYHTLSARDAEKAKSLVPNEFQGAGKLEADILSITEQLKTDQIRFDVMKLSRKGFQYRFFGSKCRNIEEQLKKEYDIDLYVRCMYYEEASGPCFSGGVRREISLGVTMIEYEGKWFPVGITYRVE